MNMTWRTGAIIHVGANSFSTLHVHVGQISSGPAALLGLRFWGSFLIPSDVFCIDGQGLRSELQAALEKAEQKVLFSMFWYFQLLGQTQFGLDFPRRECPWN